MMMNTDMADEVLMDVRFEIGEQLVALTGIDASQFNILSTDTLVALMQAFEGVRDEGYNLGAWEGGRDALTLSDLGVGDLDVEFVPFSGEPLYTNKLNAEKAADLADADAAVLDSLTLRVQEIMQRIEAIEMSVGLKYAPES